MCDLLIGCKWETHKNLADIESMNLCNPFHQWQMIRGQEKSGRDYSTQNVKGKGRQLLLNHNNHRYTEIIKSKQQPNSLSVICCVCK